MPLISADQAPPANPASTVILLRPANNGFEVLLLLRAKAIKFAGGAWVFPGGRIDPEDGENAGTDNLDSYAAASIAAARESEEEAGLTLDPESFVEYSHWTTPLAEKKRFSTWFLLGDVDSSCTVTVDDGEIVEYQWLTPQQAIDEHRSKTLKILPPTYLTLLELAQFEDIAEVRNFAAERSAPRFFPNMVFHDKTVSVLYQDDPGYKDGNAHAEGDQHRMTMIDDCWHYIQPR
ncbi:MAG: NUDIX hydrolase [Cellvibrionaceae bacterium]|nr:NUDIX hydrolase [Cellvibrionaceae bacterium]|tara:strand:+ start:13811 stop:14512 length:702 start_codon:yes stop_codon:yes gene_type:complete